MRSMGSGHEKNAPALVGHCTDGAALMFLTKNELCGRFGGVHERYERTTVWQHQLRKHFEVQRAALPTDVIEGLERYIPEVRGRSRHSFVLSASSDGDSMSMWRYHGRHQVSLAVGLDRNEPLVPQWGVPVPKFCAG